MTKRKLKGGTLLAPVPAVMVSCGTAEHPNIVTVAWTGILNTIPPKTYISLRPSRYSYGLIKESGEFVLNLTPSALVKAVDYCGTYTGAKVNKFEKCSLTPITVSETAVPLIEECPVSICCRVSDTMPLGSHEMFVADITAIYADETLFDQKGRLCMEKAHLSAYMHGEYYALGKKIGSFGFSAVKKKKHRTTPLKKGVATAHENKENSPH